MKINLVIPCYNEEDSVRNLYNNLAEFGDNTESTDYRQDDFFLVEPGFKIELNPWPNIALGLGLNYRYVFGSELVGLKDPHLSDISSLVELRFEDFDYWFSQ